MKQKINLLSEEYLQTDWFSAKHVLWLWMIVLLTMIVLFVVSLSFHSFVKHKYVYLTKQKEELLEEVKANQSIKPHTGLTQDSIEQGVTFWQKNRLSSKQDLAIIIQQSVQKDIEIKQLLYTNKTLEISGEGQNDEAITQQVKMWQKAFAPFAQLVSAGRDGNNFNIRYQLHYE